MSPVVIDEPSLTTAGQWLYEAVGPLMKQDEDNGFVGARLCGGLATMLDPVVAVVSDRQDGGLPGWAPVFDVQTNDTWLDWMGQFVGVSRPVGANDGQMRTLVENPVGFNRGTVKAMITAMRVTLTGGMHVLFNIRAGGDPFFLTCATFTSETPDPQATLLALQSQIPAWFAYTYTVVTGGSYATLAASHASYTLMEAAHATYADVPDDPAA